MFVWVIKRFYYNKVNVSEGIDINKSNRSKECTICHYWYFKDIGYKFEPYARSKCLDISIIAYDLENIAILNVKGVDYRSSLWNITRRDATNRLNNSKLDDKGTLYIWILVQIKWSCYD